MVLRERALTVEELETLCTAFLKIHGMRERRSRDLYIDILNSQRASTLSAERYPDPYHDVWALLRACQNQSDGIRALAGVVRSFYRDSRAMRELDELIECLFPDAFLDPVEREQLLVLLADIEPRRLDVACRYAGPPSWLTGPMEWGDPEVMVRRLESCLVPPGVLPPLLVFVDFLAHQAGAVRAAEKHRWIDRVGTRNNIEISTLRALCVSAVARLEEVQRFYFIVQLQPDGLDPDGYLMSVWLQQHGSIEQPVYQGEQPLSLPAVIERLPDLLRQAHALEMDELTVEFILPRSLIGHPVDQWKIDRVFPHSLGTRYPVVVRSVERLHRKELHSEWRRKWRWLVGNGHRDDPSSIFWVSERRFKLNSLHAGLIGEESVVALAMAFPPDDSHDLKTDELTAALYAGVPVVLWCRDVMLRDQFEQDVRDLLSGHGLNELPARVLRLRQKADELDTSTTLGRHLTLLWDDADRIPESVNRPIRLQAPR